MPKTPAPPTFDPTTYSKVVLNDLVVYAVHTLHKQGSEVKPEDVISACFVMFPKRFALRKYPQWPDAGIVSRRWGDCKRRGYLRGNAASGFQITARGIKRAEKVEKSLGKPLKRVGVAKPKAEKPAVPAVEAIHPELKARARKYVRSIETSDAYKHYRKNMSFNEFDFRSLLLCTMESPPATLSRNLAQFKEYVNVCERKDLLAFLEFTEGKFSHLVSTASKPARKK